MAPYLAGSLLVNTLIENWKKSAIVLVTFTDMRQ